MDAPAQKHRGGKIGCPRVACMTLVILTAELWWRPPVSVCSRCQAALWGRSQLSVGGSLARGFGKTPHLSDLSVPSGLSVGWPFLLQRSRPVPSPPRLQ